jgi:hypothetical protein
MVYEKFMQEAAQASRGLSAPILIPELRRALGHVAPETFDDHLLRMERNGLVYLVSAEGFSEEGKAQGGVLRHPSGGTRCCLVWMRQRAARGPALPD